MPRCISKRAAPSAPTRKTERLNMKRKKHQKSGGERLVVVTFIVLIASLFCLPLMVGRTPVPPVDPGLIDTHATEAQPPENPDGIHAGAWCDHMPIWKESGLKRHIAVEGNHHVEINSFEVRLNGKLLGACVRLGKQPKDTDLSRMQAEGMFNENMHGTELEVTVQYTLKVSCCVRLKKSFVTRCVIGITN